MPCTCVEWRSGFQVNFTKSHGRAQRAMCGRSATFLQNTARADVPWSDVWRGLRRSMDTNRRHRASRYALEARRMAIALSDELQEQGTEGYYDLRERGTPVHRRLSPNNRNPHQRTARVREFAKGWSRNLLRRNQAKLTPSTAETLSTKSGVFMDKMAFRAVLSRESALFMDKIESTRVSDLVTAKS